MIKGADRKSKQGSSKTHCCSNAQNGSIGIRRSTVNANQNTPVMELAMNPAKGFNVFKLYGGALGCVVLYLVDC